MKKTSSFKKRFSDLSVYLKNIKSSKKERVVDGKNKNTRNPRVSAIRLSMKEQIFFAKRLSFLIKANVPVLDSLHMIREQTKSKRYAKIIDSLIKDVSNGQYLSVALGKFRKSFGELTINVIYVGETTGILSENLEYLAEELKKKHALRRKVVGAFIYPALVTVATLAITSFLVVFLFPKLMPVFSSLNVELPFTTKLIIFISNFLKEFGIWLIAGIIALSIGIPVLLKKVRSFHFLYDKIVLKLPLVGKMIVNYNLANLSRTLGLLLKSGVTLSEALPMAGKATNNLIYKSELDQIYKVVNRGEKISNHLKKRTDIFPEVFSQIISVGERSGSLSSSLMYLSEMYESEVEDFTKNLSNLIEPVLMIFMGIMVGFVAISIIIPIYGITQNLQP